MIKNFILALCILWFPNFSLASIYPGKGLEIVPGDTVEYKVTKYDSNGKASSRGDLIWIALGHQGEYEAVSRLELLGDILIKKETILLDPRVEMVEKGKLIESSADSPIVGNQKIDCMRQKRKFGGTFTTIWRSPKLPFGGFAKLIDEGRNGEKTIIELVYFGRATDDTIEFKAFKDRLAKLRTDVSPVHSLVGRRFAIRDDSAGQELTFRCQGDSIQAVWRVLGSTVHFVSEVESPTEIRNPRQNVFEVLFDAQLRDKNQGKLKLELDGYTKVRIYLNGVLIIQEELTLKH